ncbi:MAG: STAS domain-containing protein [Ruminiclostridium sp.]|nr:STAS domain-containing protein [Ruminiclostridium sp.]
MNYIRSTDGRSVTVELIGEVDAANVPEIEERLLKELEGTNELIFDLKKLEYISSAGLRVLLQMQKLMKAQGEMFIKNASDEIMEIFRVTGFVRLLSIK